MKRLLSLFLSIVIIITSLSSLFSCGIFISEIPGGKDPTPPNNHQTEDIIIPEFKDYSDRGSVFFNQIQYARPDMQDVVLKIEAAAAAISDDSLSFEEKINEIIKIEAPYSDVLTMMSYASIKQSADTTDTYWNDEYSYISENYPTFARALERLFVAAATSPDAERFENEYFGAGLIERYKDGGIFTEELVELTTRETELENEYSEISEANTVITYAGTTDTCEALLKKYEDIYGNNAKEYARIKDEINALYEKERSKKSVDIYIELLKVRRDIAEERGFESYVPHAYENIGHEYTEDKLLTFIDDVAEYIVPVWATLETYVFSTMSDTSDGASLSKNALFNGLYRAYESMDESLHEVYSYMLSYGLYDVKAQNNNRFDGSFETYLNTYNSPFLFVTTSGTTNDYMSLSHEFGHFFDSFINYGQETSIDLAEVSSTALEYLTFLNIGERLGNDARDRHFSLVRNALSTLVFQSFYALFEHNVYALSREEINEASIVDAMLRAAEGMGLNKDALLPDPDSGIYHSLDYVLIPHVFISPCYVQSYCTSMAVSLELYFMEKSNTGEGVRVYLDLINREGTPLLFEDYLESKGLGSPFESGLIRELAYKLYYDILGDYRYDENVGISSKRSISPAA